MEVTLYKYLQDGPPKQYKLKNKTLVFGVKINISESFQQEETGQKGEKMHRKKFDLKKKEKLQVLGRNDVF